VNHLVVGLLLSQNLRLHWEQLTQLQLVLVALKVQEIKVVLVAHRVLILFSVP
jgi:hypothetical protein